MYAWRYRRHGRHGSDGEVIEGKKAILHEYYSIGALNQGFLFDLLDTNESFYLKFSLQPASPAL